jgi:hypothetical protein
MRLILKAVNFNWMSTAFMPPQEVSLHITESAGVLCHTQGYVIPGFMVIGLDAQGVHQWGESTHFPDRPPDTETV